MTEASEWQEIIERNTPSFSVILDRHISEHPFRDELVVVQEASGMEQVEKWAQFVKTHPGEWKDIHTDFMNAFIENMNAEVNGISAQPGGKEKFRKLRNIKIRDFDP
jgi:hypothetical protein